MDLLVTSMSNIVHPWKISSYLLSTYQFCHPGSSLKWLLSHYLPGCCRIILLHSNDNDASFIALQKSKDLYFITGLAPSSSGYLVSRLATKPQLLYELWHQHLGHPGPTQLSLLANHITFFQSQLTMGLYPMHSYQACNDDNSKRAPMGTTSDTDPLLSGTRFYLNCGFIRASSFDFSTTPGHCAATSYDGNNTYLIIICAKTRHTWIFCQAYKSPPIFIIEWLLALHGIKTGPRFLRMDQGGKLWHSNQLREVAATSGYAMEPTGSDVVSGNGKVERPNGTFGSMVPCLLYSVSIIAIFWSAALVHAVYLKKILYHKALRQTLYEDWTGDKLPLSHLRTFGALVTAQKPGK
jgi:hypothetical protein